MSFVTDFITNKAASLFTKNGRLMVDAQLSGGGSSTPDTDSTRTPVSMPQGATTTGSVASATSLFSADLSSYLGVTVQVVGTWAGTITFECSENNTVWQSVMAVNVATGAIATTTTANGVFVIPRVARYIRARVSTYTSGTVAFGWTPYSEQAMQFNLATILSMPNVTLAGSANLAGDVGLQVRSTGGTVSIARLLSSAATTNATSVKTSAGKLVKLRGYNAVASVRYLKLYNKASAPTVGTDTPVLTLALPASSAFEFDMGALGLPFATGIAYAITGAAADADTTAVAAGDITCLNVLYV